MEKDLLSDIKQTTKSNNVSVESFLQKRDEGYPLIDVRSPAEYEKGHIPGAVNIPLFNNEERALIGTLYFKRGKEDAVSRSLEVIGPKLKDFATKGISLAENQEILVYCWRGGMRSSSMAWLFETIGLKTSVLTGGYKSYRHYIHNYLSYPFSFIVIGGMTGSGKTELLTELNRQGYPVVNLEKLASHKGSVFGAIGEPDQPTNEHFENLLFENMFLLDKEKPVFIEDESISIGSLFIPKPFHQRMLECPLLNLIVPHEERIERLVNIYTCVEKKVLIHALGKIEKRLGTENTRRAIGLICRDNFDEAVFIVLHYYDKIYYRTMQNLHKGEKTINLEFRNADLAERSQQIIACLTYEKLL
ncbi:MAG: tRNA 2-selenouridine(34) synthase MnmH [Bacteroidales bacterium]|nr:tRNA 2-selenouridine(34) synthase MnmH [Bacteroidales bacterium]MBN2762009.1 tRNA 2-selenouridine(34) synthase MnmH [Bacteroidales bacterium]